MAPRVTITEVARHAGVSVGTVSHVLNRPDRVGEERRAKVMASMATLGYVPNKLAQGLRQGRSQLVAMCLPHMASAYFAALADAFEGVASRAGFEVMQVLSHQEPERELRRLAAVLPHRLAGLVIVPSRDPQASFDLIAASDVPAVVLDRPSPDPRFDYVTTDNRAAMLEAAHALLGLGHRHILYLVSHPGLVTTRERIAALREAAGEGARASIMVQGADEADFAQRFAGALRSDDAPTAIIASNTVIALWMMRAVTALGLAWPRDVSLLAFEAPDWAGILQPALAAIEHPTARMAELAWDLLLGRMEDPARESKRIALTATLHLRSSIGPPGA
jgi:LacI family transcriptional regulator